MAPLSPGRSCGNPREVSTGSAGRRTRAWALLSRRSSPYLDGVLGVAAATLAVASLLSTDRTGLDPHLLPVLLLVSLYSLAAHGYPRRDGAVGLGTAIVGYAGLALLDVPDLGTTDLLEAGALLLTA